MTAHDRLFRTLTLTAVLAACGEPLAPPAGSTDPASVSISPGSVAFSALGRQRTLEAAVLDAAGDTLPDTLATWAHLAAGVTSVTTQGVVTALAAGVDSIVAAAGGVADTIVVTVLQVPATVAIQAPTTTLSALGATVTLSATVRDSNNRVVPGQAISWSSSNPTVLPVDPAGRVTAARVGLAVITAASGSLTATLAMTATVNGPVGGPITGGMLPCAGGQAGPFPCSGLDLLSYLPVGAIGGGAGVDLSDLWGWTDPVTGDEWAIVTRRDGTAFVNVTHPENPVYAGQLLIPDGANANVWHDVKVYADHAYIVADGAGAHGMQVFDLRQLRGVTGPPVTFTATAHYTNVASVHNIALNEATGFAYLVGSNGGGTNCGGGLHMVDVRNPAQPAFAGCFADPLTGRAATGYTHDVQCVIYAGPHAAYAGREICIGANETALSVADVTDKAAPVAISRAAYPNVGYAHQGWLSPDHRHFFLNDELDELYGSAATTRTVIWDLTDLEDPLVAAEYFGPTSAIDHNHYVAGTLLFASNYQYGIRVLDVANPTAPAPIGHFDTAPDEPDQAGYGGSWSNYPFFASGIIVVTSRAQGLFVLRRQ
jgi:choice-of-anchor B domain-containing protein